MVAVSLTHENVKEMANRLRQFLAAGGTSIKQTHAYEAIAKSLGYRDWNTLVGILQSSTAAPNDEPEREAGRQSRATPALLLLVDRHAMAAHGVTVAQIEAAFRREFPAMLETRSQWETLCHEQLPLGPLPPFSPPTISVSLQMPEHAHVHDVVMDCMSTVAQPKWIFMEEVRAGELKFTFMFFPEHDVENCFPQFAKL